MRVAIYPRVSREEQVQGYSLAAQLEACRAYAAAQGWEVVAEVVMRVVIEGQQVSYIKLRPGFEFDSDKSESPDLNPRRNAPPEILVSLIYADEVTA
jgi:hypothetical protein